MRETGPQVWGNLKFGTLNKVLILAGFGPKKDCSDEAQQQL
jgi:hypothetical protein